jgi:hypothetical protein
MPRPLATGLNPRLQPSWQSGSLRSGKLCGEVGEVISTHRSVQIKNRLWHFRK